jgi:hypothetical protein
MSQPRGPSSVTRFSASVGTNHLTCGPTPTKLKFCLCWRSSGAEQLPCKQWVGGSNPPASASASRCFSLFSMRLSRMPAGSGRYPSGQRGQTVNLLAYAFGGSNPPLPTIVADVAHPDRILGGLRTKGVVSHRAGSRELRLARGNSSAVERQPSKLGVAGSNPVSRSRTVGGRGARRVPRGAPSVWGLGGDLGAPDKKNPSAHVAQLVEHALGKGEVSGSIPDMGSISTA